MAEVADEAVVQMVVEGPEGVVRFEVVVADGTCGLTEKTGRTADLVLGLTSATFVRFVNGEINPVHAYTNGELRLAGDPGLAFVVQRWFGRK